MHILILFKDQRSYTMLELLELTNYEETVLEELLQEKIKKKIIRFQNEKYTLNKRYFIGQLDRKETFGFLLLDKGDLYIDGRSLGNALNRDTVLVKQGRDNKIVEVLKRSLHEVICVVKKYKNKVYLAPKANIGLPVVVRRTNNLLNDEVVLVELVEFKKYEIEGYVKERIGFLHDPDIEILTLVYEHGFPYKFSKDVLKEAREIDENINLDSREIVEDEYIVTIDGEDAKDLDDAVSLKMVDGNYHLSIHIADVSHYVKEGSYIDQEAYQRATSAYLADRVIPMLPQRLSNELCSLNENLKYTLSVFMTLDSNGILINHEVKETIIKVDQRLSYNQVNNYYNGETLNNEELEVMLDNMKELASLLGKQRHNKGSIDFESVEYQYILDDENNIQDIKVREQGTSENIIEEFMVLTNETIGSHLFHLDLPSVFRVHETPKEDKLEELFTQLRDLNIKTPRHKTITPKTIQTMLEEIEQRPDKLIIHELMLRAMNRAKYEREALGHFGLAKEYYSHFTAPIRRYPDLLLHRIVKDFLINPKDIDKRIQYYESNIPRIAKHSSEMERISINLEREVDKLKIAEFMQDKVGQTFKGIVSGITKIGIFVKIDKGIEGMIPVRDMEDVYYYSSEKKQLTGASSNQKFNLGRRVVVKLVDVNVELRQITFKFLR